MKQSIETKQLIENTSTRKKIEYMLYKEPRLIDYAMAQQITIGKIIEVLYEYDCDIRIESAGKQWYVGVAGHIETQAIELVDALWEAVKVLLEESYNG